MKLKKSFLVKRKVAAGKTAAIVFLISSLFSSCVTSNFSVPVPGQGKIKINNIYTEYYNIAETYFKLEEYSRAAEYYELAMRKKDQYWAAYYKLAKCYIFNSEWNSALPMYKKILERDPDNSTLKASLAYIYSMQSDFKKSIKIYEELLIEQPDNQEYLENYIAVLAADNKRFAKKNAVKFTEAYERLKETYPENKNLKIFEEKYKELMDIKEEESENEENLENEDEDESGSTEETEDESSIENESESD